jgi:hypothetical protein
MPEVPLLEFSLLSDWHHFCFYITVTTNHPFSVMGLTSGQELTIGAHSKAHGSFLWGGPQVSCREQDQCYRFDWDDFLNSDCAKPAMEK